MGDNPRFHRGFRPRSGVDTGGTGHVTFCSLCTPSRPLRSVPLVASAPLSQVAPVRATAPETPFFFDVNGFPVYAVHHAPVPGRTDAPVVVHVHGLGVEQITLYRQEVLCARAAAAAGFPVLRYHARGHGDSAGSSADVTLASLVADARAAADEAKRRSGATRVIWLGVRLGALVAALAGGPTSDRDDAAGFIFWEPIAKPAEFFRQQLRTLLFSQVAGGKKPDSTVDQLLVRLENEGSIDVLGYALYRSLVHSFGDVTLAAALDGPHAPVCLAQVQARGRLAPAHVALIGALQGTPNHAPAEASGSDRVNGDSSHTQVATANIQQEPGYQEMSNPAWQCDALTQVTLEWLDALA